MSKSIRNLNRRDFIKTSSAATSTLALGTYLPRAWAAEPMKVSAYGGYFEDSLAEFVYPEFTKSTGIEIESVSQTGSDSWFVAIDTALKAGGDPPTDVTMGGGSAPRRFGQLYQHLDESLIPGAANIPDYLLHRKEDGVLDSVAVLAWYAIFVTNTEIYPEAPESWGDMWTPAFKDSLGIGAEVTGNSMLEIIEKTFHPGEEMMTSKEGLTTLMEDRSIPRLHGGTSSSRSTIFRLTALGSQRNSSWRPPRSGLGPGVSSFGPKLDGLRCTL